MSTKANWYQGQLPTAASSPLFTADDVGTIDAVTLHNTSTTTASVVDVWLDVTGGGGAVDATKVDSVSVAANGTRRDLLVNHALPRGAKVYMMADAATTVTCTISGRKG